MQCPNVDQLRKEMYKILYQCDKRLHVKFKSKLEEIFYWLKGKNIAAIYRHGMFDMLATSGKYINMMYRQVINNRTGIGLFSLLR